MLLEVSRVASSATVLEVRRRGAAGLIFSFPVVLSAFLVVLTVLTLRGRFNDPDMWWHLKTGEIIWNTHHIPTVDTFSFTTNNHAYVPHEWLSQLTIYGAYHFGGYTGLMLWLCVLASALVVAGFALSGLYSGNVKVAFLGGMITWVFATIGLAIRPQMIGYLFLVGALIVIHLGRTRDPRWLFALPPMFAVWVNCHGSFFLGLMLVGVALVCSFIEVKWGNISSQRWSKEGRNTFAIAFLLSIAALFVNPIGWNQVTYPLNTLLNQTVGTTLVSEWQPVHFDDMRGVGLLAVAGLILLVPLLRKIDVTVEELLFLALGFGLALQHARMLFVFGILAAPVLCRLLADCWDQYEPDRDRPAVNAVVIAVLMCVVIKVFPRQQELMQQVEKNSPVKAIEFINRSGLTGNMLNDYVFGGYLIWSAPQHKVFVDGRADVFEWTGVLGDYQKWVTLEADPNILLNKYQIKFCLLPESAPMSRVLSLLSEWKKVYSDEVSVVWVKSPAGPVN